MEPVLLPDYFSALRIIFRVTDHSWAARSLLVSTWLRHNLWWGHIQHLLVKYIVWFKITQLWSRMIAVSSPKSISRQEFLTNVESAWGIDLSGVKIISPSVDRALTSSKLLVHLGWWLITSLNSVTLLLTLHSSQAIYFVIPNAFNQPWFNSKHGTNLAA